MGQGLQVQVGGPAARAAAEAACPKGALPQAANPQAGTWDAGQVWPASHIVTLRTPADTRMSPSLCSTKKKGVMRPATHAMMTAGVEQRTLGAGMGQ